MITCQFLVDDGEHSNLRRRILFVLCCKGLCRFPLEVELVSPGDSLGLLPLLLVGWGVGPDQVWSKAAVWALALHDF